MVLQEMSPLSRFLILIAIALASIFLFAFIGLIVAMLMYNISMAEFQALDASVPRHLEAMKMMQLLNAVSWFFIPPIIMSYIGTRRSFKEQFYFTAPKYSWMILLVPVLAWVITPLINIIGEWNQGFDVPDWMRNMEAQAEITTKAFLKVDGVGGLLFNILLVGIIPGIGEELFFRGGVQPMLTRVFKNYHLGIWVTAILFSVLHFQFLGFIPRMMLGVVFGYLLVWTGSLWVPAIAHFVNNTTIVVLYYLMDRGVVSKNIEDAGTRPGELIPFLVTSLVLTSGILWLYYKNRRRHLDPTQA